MSLTARLGGHPAGSFFVYMPDDWTDPPPIVYAAKLLEAGRHLDPKGVTGVRFRLMTRDDGTPVILPDGSADYWYEPSVISDEPTA